MTLASIILHILYNNTHDHLHSGYDSNDDDALNCKLLRSRLPSHALTTIKHADLTEKSGDVIVMAAFGAYFKGNLENAVVRCQEIISAEKKWFKEK